MKYQESGGGVRMAVERHQTVPRGSDGVPGGRGQEEPVRGYSTCEGVGG